MSTSYSSIFMLEHLRKDKEQHESYAATEIRYRKRPDVVFHYFFTYIAHHLTQFFQFLASKVHNILLGIAVLVAFWSLRYTQFAPVVHSTEGVLQFICWWFVLGVMSSIGLGTGMHTGLMFLFPYILDTSSTMYINDPTVSVFRILLNVFPACFLWGAGTAVGEIPPYLMARSSLGGQGAGAEDNRLLQSVQMGMTTLLKKYGFWAILFFAAYPNMFFDMCGLVCGYLGMSFFTFFSAVFIGKALIKVNGQALFIVYCSKPDYIIQLTDKIALFFPKAADFIRESVEQQVVKVKNKETTNKSLMSQIWNWVISFCIAYFVFFFVKSLAQQFYIERRLGDHERIRREHEKRAWKKEPQGPVDEAHKKVADANARKRTIAITIIIAIVAVSIVLFNYGP